MAVIERGYKGLELLVQLNLDRIFTVLAMAGALYAAAYVATL